MKITNILLVGVSTLLFSCGKKSSDTPQNTCASISALKVNSSTTVIQKGQTLNFSTDSLGKVTYSWQLPGSLSTVTSYKGNIAAVDFTHEGWYKLEVRNNCNEVKKDSFFVDVIMPQGSPACSPATNSISYSAAGHVSGAITSVSTQQSSIPNDAYLFSASAIQTELAVYFHPSFRTNNKQPDEGVYTTGSYNSYGNVSFGTSDFDKVFVIIITYSPATIFYKAIPNQKVYVTKVNGKLKATICDMAFNGSSNGTPYSSNVTLSMLEP